MLDMSCNFLIIYKDVHIYDLIDHYWLLPDRFRSVKSTNPSNKDLHYENFRHVLQFLQCFSVPLIIYNFDEIFLKKNFNLKN